MSLGAAQRQRGTLASISYRQDKSSSIAYVTPEAGGADIFCFAEELVDLSPDDVRDRTIVEFRVEWDEQKGKERAVDVRRAGGKEVWVRTPVNNIEYFPPNFEGLVLGCIDASKQASKYVRSILKTKRDPGIRAPIFASKYSLESSRRDLHNALLCTVLQSQNFSQKSHRFFAIKN